MISRLLEEREIVLYCDLHVIYFYFNTRDIIEKMEFLCMDAIMIMMKKNAILKEFFHSYYLKEHQTYFSLKNVNSRSKKARKEQEE